MTILEDMTAPPTSSAKVIRISGKRVLLVLLGGLAVLTIALYWVIIPMHFGGKERIQQEFQQSQSTQVEPAH